MAPHFQHPCAPASPSAAQCCHLEPAVLRVQLHQCSKEYQQNYRHPALPSESTAPEFAHQHLRTGPDGEAESQSNRQQKDSDKAGKGAQQS
ncbi:hypothetical protein Y1Q_0003506 [Alligator mississippiensis]|uniref:Uncharacterized protein n=1 Tax=Alligator mississippiensis TaxID=8496 RepID=A0A151M4E5_ALLMI|nr:hypothetical protein Y1Q_0003506 [Alligator mississippiensis]